MKTKDTERIKRAGKILAAVIDGTVMNFGGLIESCVKTPTGKKLTPLRIYISDLPDAIADVNAWLAEKKISGRVQRIDSGGAPEWALVDL